MNTTTTTPGTFVSLQLRTYRRISNTKNQVKKIRLILENSKSEYLTEIHQSYREAIGE